MPVSIICSEKFEDILFLTTNFLDISLIVIDELRGSNFASKIIGMKNTPFNKTIFMDTDTYMVECKDGLFDVLEKYDIGMCIHEGEHTALFESQPVFSPFFNEFNTGMVVYVKNDGVLKLLDDWLYNLKNHVLSKDYFDMP